MIGQLVKLAVSLLALEAKQAWKRWRTAPHRVPQSQGEWEWRYGSLGDLSNGPVWHQVRKPSKLEVVQGGRR